MGKKNAILQLGTGCQDSSGGLPPPPNPPATEIFLDLTMNTVQCVRHRAFGTVRGTRIETHAVFSFTRGPILGPRTVPNARCRVNSILTRKTSLRCPKLFEGYLDLIRTVWGLLVVAIGLDTCGLVDCLPTRVLWPPEKGLAGLPEEPTTGYRRLNKGRVNKGPCKEEFLVIRGYYS